MVLGNATQFPQGLFAPTAALTTEIVTDMPGATEGSLLEHALFSMALLLLVIAMLLIVFVRVALRRRS
jgi:phosphate transport system permease protein